MKKAISAAAAALAMAGCGTTAAPSTTGVSSKPNTTGVPSNPGDRQTYENAVGFQHEYMARYHVDLATAQCVWPLTKAAGGSFPTAQVMAMNPHKTPLGDCTKP